MQVVIIIIGVALIIVLLWGIKLIRKDYDGLLDDNLRLIDKVKELQDKNYELNKTIRTNGIKYLSN